MLAAIFKANTVRCGVAQKGCSCPSSAVEEAKMKEFRFLHNYPHPCMVDFFNNMAARGISLKVYFQARYHSTRPWVPPSNLAFDHEFLPGKVYYTGQRIVHLNWGIRRLVGLCNTKVIWILSGFTEPAFQSIVRQLNLNSLPWILLNEAPKRFYKGKVSWRDTVRKLALIPVRKAKGVIVFGAKSDCNYFKDRLPDMPVFSVPQLVDTSSFTRILESRMDMRRSRGNNVRILYCGQWERAKRIDLLFDIALRLIREHASVEFCFVGKGSLSNVFEEKASFLRTTKIELKQSLTSEALFEEYAKADVLVQPAPFQGWGMAVTEGLAAGLPIVSSRGVGAAQELVCYGREGFLFEPDDFVGLETLLRGLIEDVKILNSLTAHAVKAGAQLSIDAGVNRFLAAIERIEQASGRKDVQR